MHPIHPFKKDTHTFTPNFKGEAQSGEKLKFASNINSVNVENYGRKSKHRIFIRTRLCYIS